VSHPVAERFDIFVESSFAIGRPMRGVVDGVEVTTAPLTYVYGSETRNPRSAVTWADVHLMDGDHKRWVVRARGFVVGRLRAQCSSRRRQEVLL